MKSTRGKRTTASSAKTAAPKRSARSGKSSESDTGTRKRAKRPAAPMKLTTKKKSAAAKLTTAAANARSPIVELVLHALEDMKAVNVVTLDVRNMTDVADAMIIASGNSDRHVRSIAERVVEFAKRAGYRPMGVEGERDGEWVLVDLQDVIVHVMLPRVREFYRLENLWDVTAARREAAG